MHVQSCCFAAIKKPVAFLAVLVAVAVAVVVKLRLDAIQKFCHHGNVTSHFSSLLKTISNDISAGQTSLLQVNRCY